MQKVIDPILLDASLGGTSDIAQRARRFMERFRQEGLVQRRDGEIVTLSGRPASAGQVEAQAFQLTVLDN
ncbi:MAG TPA: hypothetical protein DIT18_08995 [Pseudomonas sp.]|nr:hypothetical protein [Pseudomonas sp.]